jgi:hypothetical protein
VLYLLSCTVFGPKLCGFGPVFLINWANSLLLIKSLEIVSFHRPFKKRHVQYYSESEQHHPLVQASIPATPCRSWADHKALHLIVALA